jgi:REP element-mobilizing transposase RayT
LEGYVARGLALAEQGSAWWAGGYFVTICVQNSLNLLSEIIDGRVAFKDPGHMVQEIWESIPRKFPTIILDDFVIMPNHVHLIIFITNPDVGVDLRVHPGQTRKEEGQTGRQESA